DLLVRRSLLSDRGGSRAPRRERADAAVTHGTAALRTRAARATAAHATGTYATARRTRSTRSGSALRVVLHAARRVAAGLLRHGNPGASFPDLDTGLGARPRLRLRSGLRGLGNGCGCRRGCRT